MPAAIAAGSGGLCTLTHHGPDGIRFPISTRARCLRAAPCPDWGRLRSLFISSLGTLFAASRVASRPSAVCLATLCKRRESIAACLAAACFLTRSSRFSVHDRLVTRACSAAFTDSLYAWRADSSNFDTVCSSRVLASSSHNTENSCTAALNHRTRVTQDFDAKSTAATSMPGTSPLRNASRISKTSDTETADIFRCFLYRDITAAGSASTRATLASPEHRKYRLRSRDAM
mmetsp:Transcript_15968/g.38679  ORF Transcript_15968/g.38679 Transcript_15968/m.38679 type:complete len:231 (+) Transcript_15968:291-983(+)